MRGRTAGSSGRARVSRPGHRLLAGAGIGAVALLAAACGSGSGPSSSASTTSTPAANTGAASTTAGSAAAVVKLARNSTLGEILVDSKGDTLYRFTKDTSSTSHCTGSCAGLWPPLLLPAGGTSPEGGPGVSGLGTVIRGVGQIQVTYDGHPLYTYSGDTAPGQTNGQGLLGTWFVMTAGNSGPPVSSTTTSPSSTTAGGGGYGY